MTDWNAAEDHVDRALEFFKRGRLDEAEKSLRLALAVQEESREPFVEADAVVKGQTASSSYKPAVLENGERVLVPPHIEAGTRIVVRPEDATYVERAKD